MRRKKQSQILLMICIIALLLGNTHTAMAMVEDMDYGDCPAPYPTLLAENGARHGTGDPNLYLGNSVDLELDGQPTPDANGDDVNGVPDDEDGVFFLTDIRRGKTADVNVIASKQGLLDAWLDFNADGDFNGPGEKIFTSFPLNAGSNILTFNVPVLRVEPTGPPSSYKPLSTYARFRFSSAGGLDPNGSADDGEVEDYRVRVWQECLYGGNAGTNEYADWVAWGRPDCWCYPRQCRGDADGKKIGFWVALSDLEILRRTISKTEPQVRLIPDGICADFNHWRSAFRVGLSDLIILRAYISKPENLLPPCDQPPITTGPYHFWTSPPPTPPFQPQ